MCSAKSSITTNGEMEEGAMKVHSIIIAMPVSEIAAARGFYEDFLGLGNEEFNLGWWSVLPRRRREPMSNSSPTELAI